MNRLAAKYIAIAFILFGVCFAAVSILKYTKGYLAYHTENGSNQEDKSKINTKENNKVKLTREEIISESTLNQSSLYTVRPKTGDKIGELYIPKLKATLPIYHGTSDDELEKGVGHYGGSVLPGEIDNCVLSGHRDTVFRKLGDVGNGDLLVVSTSAGKFTYKVKKVRIVNADDRTVIVPKPRAVLTVSTCYPFHYIGSAPKRYILVAYLITEKLLK